MKALQEAAEFARAVDESMGIRIDIIPGVNGIRIKGDGYGVMVYSISIPWDVLKRDDTALRRVIDTTVNDVLDVAALEAEDEDDGEDADVPLYGTVC